jgi:hypothetical protein
VPKWDSRPNYLWTVPFNRPSGVGSRRGRGPFKRWWNQTKCPLLLTLACILTVP